MRRILLAVTILVLVLPAMRQAEAGTDISIDFFYDNIGSDGSWVEVADYGYCWQPSIAVSNSSWRPYADGYWAYTDVGWTWISYEDFGWATYHYGRWTRLRDRGWFWVPGREWGPAWVSWRTGGDYVGWAPLPPRGGGEDYDDRPINGQVDVEFDIGPAYYNFVDVRYIGEPVLRERIFEPNLNVNYVSVTVNVTNITYTNSTFYNYGPDYNTLSRYSTRPIRRMTLERDANVDLSVAVKPDGLSRVQGDKLIIAAPLRLQKPPKPIAPKMVKEKIAKPAFEHGWSEVSDPKAQAELKRKMKGEDPKNIPPPSIKPRDNAETAQSPVSASPAAPAPGTTPATAAIPAVSANPAATTAPTSPAMPPEGKGKDKRLEHPLPMPPTAASVSPATTPPGKYKKERGETPVPAVRPPLSTASGLSPAPTFGKPRDRQQDSPSSLATSPDGTPFREPPPREAQETIKKDKQTEKAPGIMPLPPERIAPPTREAPPVSPSKRPLPPERVAPPAREASPESPPKRPLSPERMAPPNREAPPYSQPRRLPPPERVAPPNREAPPETPRKQQLPPERVAPPPGPAASGPVKAEPPRSNRGPDKKSTEPAPSPGP